MKSYNKTNVFTFFNIVLLVIAVFATQSCAKKLPSNLPPKPSPADAQPFAHDLFHGVYGDLVDFGTGSLKPGNLTPDHSIILNKYIRSASWVDVNSMSKTEQAVFWVNLQNALVIVDWTNAFLIDGEVDIETMRKNRYKNEFIAGKNTTINDIENNLKKISGKIPFTILLGNGFETSFPTEPVSVLNVYMLIDEKLGEETSV